MKIKTFPLHFTEEYLEMIKDIAKESGQSVKDFILNAIAEKINRCK